MYHCWSKEQITCFQAYKNLSRPSDLFWARGSAGRSLSLDGGAAKCPEVGADQRASGGFLVFPCTTSSVLLLRGQQEQMGLTALLCVSGLQAEVAGLGRSNGKPRPKLLHPKTPSAMRGFPKAECLSIGASPRHNSWCESLPEGRQQPSHGAGMRGPRGIWQALAGPSSGWPQAWCHGSCPWDKTAKNLWSC